jgi:hypothetical protein
MKINLTPDRKDVVRSLVQQVRAGNLAEEFSLVESPRGFEVIDGYEGNYDDFPNITQGTLIILDEVGMLRIVDRTRQGLCRCVLREKAFKAVDADFELQTETGTHVTIGAIIHSVSGGNVQAVGIARDADISQIVNDPDLLRSQVEALAENLLNEIESSLKADELAEYTRAVRDLQEQLVTEKPQPASIRQLVRTIGLLGDVEGTIGLMTRVWAFLNPLLLIAAARLG